MNLVRLLPGDSQYPLADVHGESSFPEVSALGDLALLDHPTIGLICSRNCPGKLVNLTYDLIQRLRDAGKAVIGGFHSPMEQECLRLLLRGSQPIVICPARSIENYRVPSEWLAGIAAGRLLVLSPFPADERRVTAELAERRNRFVGAVADEVFIAHAAPESLTLRLAESLTSAGKPLLTHDAPENAALLALGARPLSVDDIPVRSDLGQMPLFDG